MERLFPRLVESFECAFLASMVYVTYYLRAF